MSLRKPMPASALNVPAIAPDYLERFIADAHVIVAEGYSRLDPSTLVAKKEPDISGLIVRNSRDWLDDPHSPEWTRSYFVTEEKHQDDSALEGMRRPRIDIHIESNTLRPRPRFVFEAKRLYRSDSVANYVGKEGLGALLDGTYEANARAAGMLGYVQNGTVDDSVSSVRRKLGSERSTHGIAEGEAIWSQEDLDPRLGITWRSRHTRTGRAHVDVYHSFLRCCA